MADSSFPFTTGDRVEYLSGTWYPGVVTDVRVRGTGTPQHANVIARYVVALDGVTNTVTVHDPALLRLVTPVGFGD
jgi:hypothetical protein